MNFVRKKIYDIVDLSVKQSLSKISLFEGEQDWQGLLYVLMLENLTKNNDLKDNFDIILDYSFPIGNEKILWLSEGQFKKYFSEIKQNQLNYTQYGNFYKIDLNTATSNYVDKKILNQKKRKPFKIDFAIINIKNCNIVSLIELKFSKNLKPKDIESDIIKLDKVYCSLHGNQTLNFVIGINKNKNELIKKLPDKNEIEIECVNEVKKGFSSQNFKQKSFSHINIDNVLNILQETTHSYFNDQFSKYFFNEHIWNCKLYYSLYKKLDDDYEEHREVNVPKYRGKVDLAISKKNKYNFLIEIKYHAENARIEEIENDFIYNKKMQNDFITKINFFLNNKKEDQKRGNYPKLDTGKVYINNDFVDKLIEIYYQYKRLEELINTGFTENAKLVFSDWNYKIKNYSLNNDIFFSFREKIIKTVIEYDERKKTKFVYIPRAL